MANSASSTSSSSFRDNRFTDFNQYDDLPESTDDDNKGVYEDVDTDMYRQNSDRKSSSQGGGGVSLEDWFLFNMFNNRRQNNGNGTPTGRPPRPVRGAPSVMSKSQEREPVSKTRPNILTAAQVREYTKYIATASVIGSLAYPLSYIPYFDSLKYVTAVSWASIPWPAYWIGKTITHDNFANLKIKAMTGDKVAWLLAGQVAGFVLYNIGGPVFGLMTAIGSPLFCICNMDDIKNAPNFVTNPIIKRLFDLKGETSNRDWTRLVDISRVSNIMSIKKNIKWAANGITEESETVKKLCNIRMYQSFYLAFVKPHFINNAQIFALTQRGRKLHDTDTFDLGRHERLECDGNIDVAGVLKWVQRDITDKYDSGEIVWGLNERGS